MMRAALLGVLLVLAAPRPGLGADTFLLVISGLGGDEGHSEQFHGWAIRLLEAAAKAGIADENVTYLAEQVERDATRISDRSTKEVVTRVLSELAVRAGELDLVWIILIGHGSAADGTVRVNLPGPDMTAEDFAAALSRFSSRVAFVNTASASGGFIPFVAGGGRAVVTATKSAGQQMETVFAEPFIGALEAAGADLDKNGRVSLLEAFDFARQEVAKYYAEKGLLATENPLLEDDGDGQGTLQPPLLAASEGGGDGMVASRMFFDGGTGAASELSPELAALVAERESLERRIEDLRLQKAALPEELYLGELEKLLLELASTDESIRERNGNPPPTPGVEEQVDPDGVDRDEGPPPTAGVDGPEGGK